LKRGFAALFAAKLSFAGLAVQLPAAMPPCLWAMGGGIAAKIFLYASEKHSFSANRWAKPSFDTLS
jgi:hypothetical protein